MSLFFIIKIWQNRVTDHLYRFLKQFDTCGIKSLGVIYMDLDNLFSFELVFEVELGLSPNFNMVSELGSDHGSSSIVICWTVYSWIICCLINFTLLMFIFGHAEGVLVVSHRLVKSLEIAYMNLDNSPLS